MNYQIFRCFNHLFKIVFLAATVFIIHPQVLAVGVLDTSFGNGGRVAVDFGGFTIPGPAIVDRENKILVLASVEQPGQRYLDVAVARFNENGSLDASFGSGGKVITVVSAGEDFAKAIALQPDGKIYRCRSSPTNPTGTCF